MKARSTKLAVEKLEDRCVPATLVEANFNNDDYMDKAELTSPSTITISLGSADGYTVSAILSLPKNHVTGGFSVDDYYADGILDVTTWSTSKTGVEYFHIWYGKGDGSFGPRDSQRITWKGW